MAVMSSSGGAEVTVTIPRDGTREPFGFRLRGGVDLKEPLVIQRVIAGTSAEGELRRGDVVVKINDRPANCMTHQTASDLIKKAGTTITLVVKRCGITNASGGGLMSSSAGTSTPLFDPVSATAVSFSGFPFTISTQSGTLSNHPERSMSRQVSTVSGEPLSSKDISQIMQSPVENLPVTVFPGEANKREQYINKDLFPFLIDEMDRDRERIVVTHQPYRTTPLVLPGAKMGRDTATTTQCYLALQQQQNPMLWTVPPGQQTPQQQQQQQSNPNDMILKQKLEAAAALVQRNLAQSQSKEHGGGQVAVTHEPDDAPPAKQEIVHKQFNSPLGLYSNENVQEAMALQSGIMPPRPAASQQQPRMLDLKYSETLRALKEENEPMMSGASQDNRGLKQIRPPQPVKTVASNPHFKVNVMGIEKEKIQQSHSFKRLMADVLGETEF